ncbi:DUF4031 domain-containing protein [Ornithinimicrobium sp. Arc0846-15]|nr:DUF4031 domain-containing protein [Ornithinimicrobium laminariae]
MTIWIDPPRWPAHGRLWAHVISDTSAAELHEFARAAGIPERSFEGDHYDIPAERHAEVVAAGAMATSGTDLARRLAKSGLRFRKRRGERPLGRFERGLPAVGGPHTLDIIASPHEPPASSGATVVLITSGDQVVLVRNASRPGWMPPGGKRDQGETLRESAVREILEETGLRLNPKDLMPVGYERITITPGEERRHWDAGDNHIAVYAAQVPDSTPVDPLEADVLEARWFNLKEAHELCIDQPWCVLVQHFLEHRWPELVEQGR